MNVWWFVATEKTFTGTSETFHRKRKENRDGELARDTKCITWVEKQGVFITKQCADAPDKVKKMTLLLSHFIDFFFIQQIDQQIFNCLSLFQQKVLL